MTKIDKFKVVLASLAGNANPRARQTLYAEALLQLNDMRESIDKSVSNAFAAAERVALDCAADSSAYRPGELRTAIADGIKEAWK